MTVNLCMILSPTGLHLWTEFGFTGVLSGLFQRVINTSRESTYSLLMFTSSKRDYTVIGGLLPTASGLVYKFSLFSKDRSTFCFRKINILKYFVCQDSTVFLVSSNIHFNEYFVIRVKYLR